VIDELQVILEDETGGAPTGGKKWTRTTAETVAQCLRNHLGIEISATTVRRLLNKLDYSLKSNKKCLCCGSSPDRDKQFNIIKGLREEFKRAGDPIVSIDTKKKELIGQFKNPGCIWCVEPLPVKDHDFRSEAEGIASPYGIYDLARNTGVLVVGISADTCEFAVNAIATWWENHGRQEYPNAKRLLLLADGGGSNGARCRAFKAFIQEKITDVYGIKVTVAHYPTGASKWNPIEHRMFSEITKNWAGRPLESFEILLNYARGTTTKTGFRIEEAYLDKREYPKGYKVSDKEFEQLNITRAKELGKWNYTISPKITAEVMIPPLKLVRLSHIRKTVVKM